MLSPRPLSFTGEPFEGGGGEEEGSSLNRSDEEERQESRDITRLFHNQGELDPTDSQRRSDSDLELLDIIERLYPTGRLPSPPGEQLHGNRIPTEHHPSQEQQPMDTQQVQPTLPPPQPGGHHSTQSLPNGNEPPHMNDQFMQQGQQPIQQPHQPQPYPLQQQQQNGPIHNQHQFGQPQPMQQQPVLQYNPPQDQLPVQQLPPENMMRFEERMQQQQQQQPYVPPHQQQTIQSQQQQQPYFPPPQPQQIQPQHQQQMNGGHLPYSQQQHPQSQIQQQPPQNGGERSDWQLEPYRPPLASPYQQQPQQDQSAYLNYSQQQHFPIPYHNQADFQLNLNQGVNPYQTSQGQTRECQTSQGRLPPRERPSSRNPHYREERKERKSRNQGPPTATTNPSLPYFQPPFTAQFGGFPGVMDTPGPSNGFPQLNVPSTSNGSTPNGIGISLTGNGVATLPMYTFSSSNASGFNGQLVSGIAAPNGGMPSASASTSNGNALSTAQAQAQAQAEAEAAKLEAKKKKKEAQMREEFEHEQRHRDTVRQMSLATTKIYGYQPPPEPKGGAKLEGLPTGVVPSGGIRNTKPRKPRSDVLVPSSNANSNSNEDNKEAVSNALVPLINDGIPVRRPDSSSTCGEVVVFLMQYNIQMLEYDFSSKALESLHKKLKDRPEDLEMFIRVVESRGKFVGNCITVTRTLDGRLQVAGRKGFPHVIYAKIFRFTDLHKNELRSLPCCHFGFENKAENEEHKPDAQVCINPYHYERVTPQSGGSALIDPNTGLLRINAIPSMDDMMDMGNSSNNHLKMLGSDSTSRRKKASKRRGQQGDWPVISLDDDEEGIPKEGDDVESQYRVEFPVEEGDRPPLLQQQHQAAHDQYMHQLRYNQMAAAFPSMFPPGLMHIGPVNFPMQPMQQPPIEVSTQQLQIAPAPNPTQGPPAPVPAQPRQSAEETVPTVQQLQAVPPTKHARPDQPRVDPTVTTTSTTSQQQYPAHLQQEYLQQAAQAQIRPSPFNPAVAMPQTAPTYVRPVFPTPPAQPTPLSASLSSTREGTERIQPAPSQAVIPDVRAPPLPASTSKPSVTLAPTTTVASLPATVVTPTVQVPKPKPTMKDAEEYQARLYRSITRDRLLLEAEEKKEREAAQTTRKPLADSQQIITPDQNPVKQSVRSDPAGNPDEGDLEARVRAAMRKKAETAEVRKQARKEQERRQKKKEAQEALKRVPTTMEMKEEILRLQGYWEKRNEASKDEPHPPFDHSNRSRSAGVNNSEKIDKFGGDARPSSSKSSRPSQPQEQLAIQIVRTSADSFRATLTDLSEADRRTADMVTKKKELTDEEKISILQKILRKSKAEKERERRFVAEQFVASQYPSTVERVVDLLKTALEEGRRLGRQPARKNYDLLADLEKLARDKPGFSREMERPSRPVQKTNADGVARSTSNEPSTSNSITMEESQVRQLRSLSLERRGDSRRQDIHFLNAHPALLESLRLSNASVLGGFGLNALEIKTEEIDPPKESNPTEVPSPRTVTQIALEKAKEIVKSEESEVGLPPENRILGGGDGAEMMANLINHESEFSEPAAEMRECFDKMILAGAKTLAKDKLAKELESAHQQLAAMKAELDEEDDRSIHSDDDTSEYTLELQDRYKFRREILDRIEDKEKDIHAMSKKYETMKTPAEREEEKRHLVNPTIWNSEYTNDNDEPTYSRMTECVGDRPNPRVQVPATGPGTYGSKGPHLKIKSKLKILEWSVQQIVVMMEKVAKDSDINSVQYMLCCQHYAGMMARTQGAASLDPSQVKLVRAAIDAAQKMGGGDVTNQQLHLWDISKIFLNHMMTIPERRQLKERRKNIARLEQTKPEWDINIDAELDKVLAAAVGTDAEGLFSKNEVRKALERRQRIIKGEKIIPDELMECEELKNPVAKAFDNARKVMRTEDGIESEMESNDHSLNCMDEENTGEPMDMDPLLPVLENLFTPDDLFDLLTSPKQYMESFRDSIFGEEPPPIDFEERREIRDVTIPPRNGDITYEPFDGTEREHDDPDEFGEEKPPLKKNCRCPDDRKRRDHCFWGKHHHYMPGVSREIIDAAFILYRYRIKRKKSKGVNGALYNFSTQFNCPRVCMNRASEIEPHSAKTKPLGYNWAAVNYCERDNHVGLLRQVESVNFFIDGGFDTDTEQRYCISNTSHMLTRFDREVHEVRGKIGCGVRLSVKDDGSMWVRVMSRYPVFISSTFLDREAGFVTGDAVHKVYPGTAIKAFDLVRARRAILQMYDYQLEAMKGTNGDKPKQELPYPLAEFSRRELKAVARIGADDMHRHAVVKIGFVKGWGPEFEYKRICETPCWVEIINNRACEFIDHVMSTREVSYAFSEADSSDFDD